METIEPYIIKRKGVEWQLFRNVDPVTGESLGYMETVEVVPEYQQRLRAGILKIEQTFHGNDLKGRCAGISVTFGEVTLAASGEIPPGAKYREFTLTTRFKDVGYFAKIYGMGFITSALNLYWLEEKGHAHTKPYGDHGEELESTYSEYRKSIAGTFDYKTWNEGDPLPEVLIEPA